MLEKLTQEFLAQGWLDWTVLITALIYIYLAARQNVWCWFWGIISCSIWGYLSFQGKLYADALLQVFYVLISFWGIYQWSIKKEGQKELKISRLPISTHIMILVGGSLVAMIFGYLFETYTYAAATYLDSWTTILAIIATFMVTQKILENWLYWLVIDAVYIYLYLQRDLLMLAVIMIIYIVIAVFGYMKWKKEYEASPL